MPERKINPSEACSGAVARTATDTGLVGIPYQTHIFGIIHRYIKGELTSKAG